MSALFRGFMHICSTRLAAAAAMAILLVAPLRGEKAESPFAILTVDSVMRGQQLVGYPPNRNAS
jgi:hypothetical protein